MKIKFILRTVLNKKPVCDNDTILKTCARGKDYDILIAFGTGTVADVTKIVAKNLDLPFCVIPTSITHYGLFNNIAYLINNDVPKIINTEFPHKVFIDEEIIKKSPENFIISSLCFSLSLLENIFVLELKKKIIGECNIDLLTLSKKIKKIEELLNWVTLSKDFALLNLMDYIIDVSELCKRYYDTNSILYSLTFKASTLKNNFGEKCLFSSTLLINLYSYFFNQKRIYVKDIPNRDKIIKLLSKIKKDGNDYKKYMDKTNWKKKKNLGKINQRKSYLKRVGYIKIAYLDFKKILLLNNKSNLRMIDEYSLYSSLQLIPFIYDNFLLNILTRYGFLNVS